MITIIAIDLRSSKTMSQTFEVNGYTPHDMFQLVRDIEQFEDEIPYDRYELMSSPSNDITDEIEEVFRNLDVTY